MSDPVSVANAAVGGDTMFRRIRAFVFPHMYRTADLGGETVAVQLQDARRSPSKPRSEDVRGKAW